MRFFQAIFLGVILLSNAEGKGGFHIKGPYDIDNDGYKECLIFNSKNHQNYKTLITQEMLLNNILATNSVYPCIEHTEKIIKKYSEKLDNTFRKIKKCEDGYDVNKYLKSKASIKEFKRFN